MEHTILHTESATQGHVCNNINNDMEIFRDVSTHNFNNTHSGVLDTLTHHNTCSSTDTLRVTRGQKGGKQNKSKFVYEIVDIVPCI